MNRIVKLAVVAIIAVGLTSQVLAQEGLNVDAQGEVGIGLLDPTAPLHIFRDDATAEFMFLESDQAGVQDRAMMFLSNNGGIRFEFNNPAQSTAWRFQAATGGDDFFEVTKVGTGAIEMTLDGSGNLDIRGSLTQGSDVNSKKDIKPISGDEVLKQLDQLPVAEWSYITDPEGVRHLGPMAQDFHATFGLGADETRIAPGDMAGVSLAAIKTLNERNQKLENRIQELESLVERLLPMVKQD